VNLTIRNTPREQRDAKGIGLQTRWREREEPVPGAYDN
jgi:hypothetical protein